MAAGKIKWTISKRIGNQPENTEREVMAVGLNSWGRAATIEGALHVWRSQTGKRATPKIVTLIDVPKGARIDESGLNISWPIQKKGGA